ncbi:MAG TPA: FliH/SctL family protein [Acidobacteriaceae bacterium]
MLGNAQVQNLQYPVLGGLGQPSGDLAARVRELEAAIAERDKRLDRQLEAARREAAEKGREAGEAEQKMWRERRSAELAMALTEFRAQRDDYLARVEHEVVRLALAIAERILHREAQMDALLLAGAVRVALGQLADSTEVRLRVPSEQREMWEEMLRLMPGLPLRPDVAADAELNEGEAILESRLGTVDLGIRAQIAEIERGFFDLLEVRAKSGETAPVKQA